MQLCLKLVFGLSSRMLYTFLYFVRVAWGHMVTYWLRHYSTSREVAGSRSAEVNEFFQFT
jgi:hypothetical protein